MYMQAFYYNDYFTISLITYTLDKKMFMFLQYALNMFV